MRLQAFWSQSESILGSEKVKLLELLENGRRRL